MSMFRRVLSSFRSSSPCPRPTSAARPCVEGLETRVNPAPVLDASSGTTPYQSTSPPVVVDPNLSLTGGDTLTAATVAVANGFVAGQDILALPPHPTIGGSFNATTGILSLSGTGTTADYQAALRSVTYFNASGSPSAGARTISFSISSAAYNTANGHFYEFVTGAGISWTDARNASSARSLFGLTGYLATITSASENAFIGAKLTGLGWIGGSDAAVEDTWRWVTGPEGLENGGAGRHYWQGRGAGFAVGGSYTNWAGGEPNDFRTGSPPFLNGEDYAHMYADATWNDYPHQINGISGYVVEYGGMPTDPTLQLNDLKDIVISTNSAPSLGVDNGSVSTNEGQTASNTGTWSDAPGDTVTLSASVGSVVKNANGTWNWSFNTSDGPSQSQTVTITATDNQGASTQRTFALTVANVAATVTNLTVTPSTPNGPVSVSGSFTDPGVPDTHTATVDWGDGSPVETLPVNQLAKTFGGSHTYAVPGAYTVSVTLDDGEGGVTTRTATTAVAGAGLSNGVLKVYGTPGNDKIYVWRRDAGVRIEVEAAFNGATAFTRYSFPSASVATIVVDLLGGNDLGLVDGGLTKDAVLVGGAGNDQLYGGGGANILSGGAGNDTLTGGVGIDILLGGTGRDSMAGKAGDDLLVGGVAANEGDSTALLAALASWKMNNLAEALNGLGSLTDDGEIDTLKGELGSDYLHIGIGDLRTQ